ncbi:sigma-E factor negative regulatory protein [Methyloversatilis thermotolerans]|uniref:sigma-E factor negative regulatory protein n=1 Tax=Methyloversatilis thermotolerans TaxID=1346290 RepID=UPI00036611CB|nr:RseA family anti-sigma factor [Methyloversatilis thermotolerans]
MKENLSAFIDDELDGRLAQQVLDRLHADSDLRDEFALHMLIGDAIRGEHIGPGSDFTSVIMSRIEDEPTVLSPVSIRPRPEAKRLWMPAAAAVAGVALVSWLGLDMMSGPSSLNQVVATVQPSQPASVVRMAQNDAPLRAYLVAHHGYSPAGSMQGVALYARGVSDPNTDDDRR